MSWVEERLRKSFIETIERMRSEKTLLERVVANRNEVEIIKEDDELQVPDELGTLAKISLIDENVSIVVNDATCDYKEVAVLDFMGVDSPYCSGKEMSWEAQLCRCSTLYPVLCCDAVQQKFYQHHKSRGNTLGTCRGIYVPNVIFHSKERYQFLSSLKQNAYVNIVGMAAPDLSRFNGKLSEEGQATLMEFRIDRAFAIAAAKGNECFVVGAWGCGEDKCDPSAVALTFYKCLQKWRPYFKEIIFALDKDMGGAVRVEREENWDYFKTMIEYMMKERGDSNVDGDKVTINGLQKG